MTSQSLEESSPVAVRRFESSKTKAFRSQTFSHTCLSRSKFFYNRDPKFLQAVSSELSVELYPPGKEIIAEGEKDEKVYFLHRGEVEVLINGNKVAELSDGNVIGEMTLFGQVKRTATVRAKTVCDCRVIHHRVFTQILKKFPEERQFFEEMAAVRLGQTKHFRPAGKVSKFRRHSFSSTTPRTSGGLAEAGSNRRTRADALRGGTGGAAARAQVQVQRSPASWSVTRELPVLADLDSSTSPRRRKHACRSRSSSRGGGSGDQEEELPVEESWQQQACLMLSRPSPRPPRPPSSLRDTLPSYRALQGLRPPSARASGRVQGEAVAESPGPKIELLVMATRQPGWSSEGWGSSGGGSSRGCCTSPSEAPSRTSTWDWESVRLCF